MQKVIYLTISLIIFTFCSDGITNSDGDYLELSDTLLIKYQQTLYNEAKDISIKFEDLIGDGRCPVDVICVWEGDAELRFSFSNSSQTIKFNLHTAGNYFTKDTVILGYHVKLLDVFPYPHSKEEASKKSYEAKIILDKTIE